MASSVAFVVFIFLVLTVGALSRTATAEEPDAAMRASFASPPTSCRPHTRWWWMGNAIRKEDLTWQLEQMHEQGIGGVEQITMEEVYEKGNAPFLSDEYFDLVTHAIAEAKRLGLEFSLNFGGPGWVIGGEWVPPEDRSQNMIPTCARLEGGTRFSGALPTDVGTPPHTGQVPARDVTDDDKLVAVVAGRICDGVIVPGSLTDLTTQVDGRTLTWDVPEGDWQLMAFWLQRTGQGNALDHFNRAAMERYCDYLGGRFRDAFGDAFGDTVESFFCDSFEVAVIDNGIYWSDGLLDAFKERQGYDLTPYLPAIWWEVGALSPKIRYDVNAFLHEAGLDAFFRPFLEWCEANGVQGRIQPYGFPTDILEGAGMTHLPEMEITAGEKDAVPWFDTRIGPKKYVASGAHLYGRNVVTVEAYTYLHWEPYRATLEELKIASDIFLRSGANKFYNHGYTCSPERDIAPTRRFGAEILISHPNVWWPHYCVLSDYVARCCYLLRQGHFVADIAVYSPLANQWALDVRNARKWTRSFDWGGLGRMLLANGYDFDLVNDDVLLNHARFEDGAIHVRKMVYRVLLLPNLHAMPLETLQRVREFVRGGGVAIALERVPEASCGFDEYAAKDAAVRDIVAEMFDTPVWRRNPTGRRAYGDGVTYHVHNVIDRSDVLECPASALDPFLNVLRSHVTPDLGIDFVRQELRENNGLAYMHRRAGSRDIYFVANVQDVPVDMPVAFRVEGKTPFKWNPYTGEVGPLFEYAHDGEVTRVPLRLATFASTFIVFDNTEPQPHVIGTTLTEVLDIADGQVTGVATTNGTHSVQLADGRTLKTTVDGIPAPFDITGDWQLTLEGIDFPKMTTALPRLASWTDDPSTKHFSGTGHYTVEFDLPTAYCAEDLLLHLDLGQVGNIAEVAVNSQPAGMRWMHGQRLDITHAARPGANRLDVYVTNTLINHVAGLDAFPPVPESLRPWFGNGLPRNDARATGLLGYEPLPISGLLGPVTVIPTKRVTIPIDG